MTYLLYLENGNLILRRQNPTFLYGEVITENGDTIKTRPGDIPMIFELLSKNEKVTNRLSKILTAAKLGIIGFPSYWRFL